MSILAIKENTVEVCNVVPIIRGNKVVKFITNISMKEVADVYEKLTYDEKTQRGYKLVTRRTGTTEEKIINKANIAEMKEKIQNGFFDGGLLNWNVRINEGDNSYEYNIEENKLIINCNQISLPDSAQRHQAIHEVVKYPNKAMNFERFYFPLSISLYNLEEEQSLFAEINGEGQKAHKNRALYLSNSKESLMLKRIIEKSGMTDVVETKSGVNRKSKKVIGFSTLYTTVFHKTNGSFAEYLNKGKDDELELYLIDFYKELMKLRANFDKNLKSIESSYIAFYIYANIAKSLYGEKGWKAKLKRINKQFKYGAFEGDFFDIENPLWLNAVVYLKGEEYKVLSGTTARLFAVKETLKFMNLL